MTNKKLILIDGSSVLSTSFFGVAFPREYFKMKDEEAKKKLLEEKLMKTKDGRYTNAVLGMSKILLNIIKKQKPTHIAVCWDVNRVSLHRKKKFDGYKGHRKDTLPQLGSQFGLMQEVLNDMNVPQFKLEGHEADDIIGTFAKKFENEVPVYIMTKDQDSLQLVSKNTRVWLNTSKAKDMYKERGFDAKTLPVPDGAFEFTPDTFKEEYGIDPIQIIDMKALEGDTSDNIPGVKGVGETSILPLLNEYGSIEAIYDVVESNPEKELKSFFKDELGITRSPIGNLLKKTSSEIAQHIDDLLIKDIDKSSKKEIVNIFKEVDGKEFKEKVKALNKINESEFKEKATNLLSELKEIPDELVGKRAAFLSKELATIKTDLIEFKDKSLNELEFHFEQEKTKKKFAELEFKSLLEKL